MDNFPGQTEIPMGFSMALAQNLEAMKRFSGLPEAEQQQILGRTRGIRSKAEMQAFVDQLLR